MRKDYVEPKLTILEYLKVSCIEASDPGAGDLDWANPVNFD